MQSPPRIFVGIPTKNRPGFVREAVESVLAQTYSHFRIIVSDNCSEAEASADVESFIRDLDDPRVSYVLQSEDGGRIRSGKVLYGPMQRRLFYDSCMTMTVWCRNILEYLAWNFGG